MKKQITVVALGITLALTTGAKGCGKDTPVTPKPQCRDGSSRTRTVQHKPVYEECHNNEWVRTTPPKYK